MLFEKEGLVAFDLVCECPLTLTTSTPGWARSSREMPHRSWSRLWMWRPQVSPILTTGEPYTSHRWARHWPQVSPDLATGEPYTGHSWALYWPELSSILTTCEPCTGHMWALYWPQLSPALTTGEPWPDLHWPILGLHSPLILTLMRIRLMTSIWVRIQIQLFTLMQIWFGIRLPKMMRIHAFPNPQNCLLH